ncbi:Alpha-2,3-sialyltransferase [Candidatus Magnetomorum sp. HK-1]|nr:Alpha-2,3-sialyltransferase [Candidatus Magnetomorum sp. HK-1]
MRPFIQNWLLPPKICNGIESGKDLTYLYLKNDISLIKKNQTLKDRYCGKRCFIIGSAPSIKDIDILKLKKEHVFVMSTFYYHHQFNELSPEFHSNVKISDASTESEKLDWLSAIDKNVNSPYFFFDIKDKWIIDKYELFRNKNLYYIAASIIKRKFDISKITRFYRTNPLQALEIAIYMGFNPIYLHGIDLNEACINEYKHFFNSKLLPAKDPDIDQNDRSKRIQSTLFNAASLTYKEFEDIAIYANNKNIDIVNLNPKSMLQMFQIKNFTEIL